MRDAREIAEGLKRASCYCKCETVSGGCLVDVERFEEAINEARAEGMEEAAKVAELSTVSLGQSFSPNEVGRIVADVIRAKAKELRGR